jgi:hypothetical protein
MKRQPLSDGRWFDMDRAERFQQDTYWDGQNHISRATGSQWNHQILFRTASQRWILRSWSQWEGSGETWDEISDDDAARWLVRNGHDHPDAAEAIAELEV